MGVMTAAAFHHVTITGFIKADLVDIGFGIAVKVEKFVFPRYQDQWLIVIVYQVRVEVPGVGDADGVIVIQVGTHGGNVEGL